METTGRNEKADITRPHRTLQEARILSAAMSKKASGKRIQINKENLDEKYNNYESSTGCFLKTGHNSISDTLVFEDSAIAWR